MTSSTGQRYGHSAAGAVYGDHDESTQSASQGMEPSGPGTGIVCPDRNSGARGSIADPEIRDNGAGGGLILRAPCSTPGVLAARKPAAADRPSPAAARRLN